MVRNGLAGRIIVIIVKREMFSLRGRSQSEEKATGADSDLLDWWADTRPNNGWGLCEYFGMIMPKSTVFFPIFVVAFISQLEV